MHAIGAAHDKRPQNALESNPNYGKGVEYRKNCQRCVPTAEARLRGYDVEASPEWLFPTFKGVKPIGYSGKQAIEKQMAAWGVGARAQIVCLNRGGKSAHTFYAAQGPDGTHFYDPQDGNRDCSAYFLNSISFRHAMSKRYNQFARIDNLEFNDKIKLCCRPKPTGKSA